MGGICVVSTCDGMECAHHWRTASCIYECDLWRCKRVQACPTVPWVARLSGAHLLLMVVGACRGRWWWRNHAACCLPYWQWFCWQHCQAACLGSLQVRSALKVWAWSLATAALHACNVAAAKQHIQASSFRPWLCGFLVCHPHLLCCCLMHTQQVCCWWWRRATPTGATHSMSC